MTNSTTVHMQGQTRAQAGHTMAHSYRDVPDKNGHSVQVSTNSNVDPSRTHLNSSFVNDGHGGFRRCTTREEPHAYLAKRLKELPNWVTQKDQKVPRGYRKDANLVVETVIQLDPEFTGPSVDAVQDPEHKQRIEDHLTEAVQELVDLYGSENVIGWTVQWDETSPHVQMFTIPVAEDGRVSQRRFFNADKGRESAKAAYKAVHDRVRGRLRESGYDADTETRRPGAAHIPYRAYGELKAQEASVADREVAVGDEWEEVEWQRSLNSQTAKVLDEKSARIEAKNEKVNARSAEVEARSAALDAEQLRLAREYGMRLEGLDERERELDAREEKFNAEARAFVRRAEEAERVRVEAAATFRAATKKVPAHIGEYLDQPVSPGSDRTHAEVIRTGVLFAEAGHRYEETGLGVPEMVRPVPIPDPPRHDPGPEFG